MLSTENYCICETNTTATTYVLVISNIQKILATYIVPAHQKIVVPEQDCRLFFEETMDSGSVYLQCSLYNGTTHHYTYKIDCQDLVQDSVAA